MTARRSLAVQGRPTFIWTQGDCCPHVAQTHLKDGCHGLLTSGERCACSLSRQAVESAVRGG